jgi:hypothetical protein
MKIRLLNYLIVYIVLRLLISYLVVNNAIYTYVPAFSTFSTFIMYIWLGVTSKSDIMFGELCGRVVIWSVLAIPTIVDIYKKTGNSKWLVGVTYTVVLIDAIGIVLGYAFYFIVEHRGAYF